MAKKFLYKLRYPLLSLFVLILIATFVNVYISGTGNKDKKKESENASGSENEIPTVSIKPLHFSQATKGFPKFTLSAEKADFFQDKSSGKLNKFKLVYVYEKGKKITITGDEAVVKVDINEDLTMGLGNADIICTKPVKAVSTSGMNFVSEDLIWTGTQGNVVAKGNVKLYGNDFRIEGVGMKANLNDEKVEFLSNVKLMVTPDVVKKAGEDGFI